MKIEEALISITQYMEEHQIPYVIVGGFAAAAWGRVRTTYDIDIIVDQNKMDINKFVQLVKRNGLATNEEDIEQAFKEQSHTRVHSTGESFFRIDLKGIYSSADRETITTAITVPYKGVQIRFCCPENLIAHKLKYGSERDLEDAFVVILAQKDKLDETYLKNLCKKLDVIEELKNLMKKVKQ